MVFRNYSDILQSSIFNQDTIRGAAIYACRCTKFDTFERIPPLMRIYSLYNISAMKFVFPLIVHGDGWVFSWTLTGFIVFPVKCEVAVNLFSHITKFPWKCGSTFCFKCLLISCTLWSAFRVLWTNEDTKYMKFGIGYIIPYYKNVLCQVIVVVGAPEVWWNRSR